jgi:hypothetical protein
LQAHRQQLVTKVTLGLMQRLDRYTFAMTDTGLSLLQVSQVLQVQSVLQAQSVLQVQLDQVLQALLVQQVTLVRLDQLDRQVLLVQRAHKAVLDQQARKEPQ